MREKNPNCKANPNESKQIGLTSFKHKFIEFDATYVSNSRKTQF